MKSTTIEHLRRQVVSQAGLRAFSQIAIHDSVAQALVSRGYAVIDNALGADSHVHRDEIARMHRAGRLHKNKTHLVTDQTQLVDKAQILEAEITFDPSSSAECPSIAAFSQDSTIRTLLSIYLPKFAFDTQAVKVQINAGGGGCFPMHFDTYDGQDLRKVTAITYLNPGYHPSHGGQLRLYPFPAPPVDIEPIMDRMDEGVMQVLFSSAGMLHRVLPSHATRYCHTTWISQSSRPSRQAPGAYAWPTKPQQGDSALERWRYVLDPRVRPHACKLAYAQEWEESILESHAAGPGRDLLVSALQADLAILRRELEPVLDLLDGAQCPEGMRVDWL